VRAHAPDMTPAGVNDKRLLEREEEVAALDDAIRAAAAGNGSVVIVEGTLWWAATGMELRMARLGVYGGAELVANLFGGAQQAQHEAQRRGIDRA
jgi:hypothetical protein